MVSKFNQIVQADVFWLNDESIKQPILSMIDEATKFMAMFLLKGEKASDYINALERCWIAFFGPPTKLVTDKGRGWLHDDFGTWTDEHGIHHVVAAGEAHEQLALVGRRHAVLRKALEVYLADYGINGEKAIKQALANIVPQINNNPSTSGFSPAQWLLGQAPSLPGELLGTKLSPTHLGESFEDELARRATARMAIIQADTDQKLRRALLRKYAGNNIMLLPGQTCFFWRDSRSADLVKIRWKGPATVLMREDNEDGRPHMYWIGCKSQLLRAAPHHVRHEIGKSTDSLTGNLQDAKDVIKSLKSRGVTRFVDLSIQNKRYIDDIGTDEEVMDDQDGDDGDLEPPTTRQRLLDPEDVPPPALQSPPYSPSLAPDLPPADADLLDFDDQPGQSLGFPTAPEINPPGLEDTAQPGLVEPTGSDGLLTLPDPAVDVPISVGEPSREPSPKSLPPQLSPALLQQSNPLAQPSQAAEPSQQPAAAPAPQLDPYTASLYQPATAEDFRAHRRRFQLQETMSFGPNRRMPPAREVPYDRPSGEEGEFSLSAIDIEDIDASALPTGWKFEDGYISLEDHTKDFWEIKAGCLLRHHVVPRRALFDPRALSAKDLSHMLVPLQQLDNVRVTVSNHANGIRHLTDKIEDGHGTLSNTPWIGCTVFQINGETRKELGLYAYAAMTAKQIGKKRRPMPNASCERLCPRMRSTSES